jgi:UDP-N-acetylmuramyl tripeptide synthase
MMVGEHNLYNQVAAAASGTRAGVDARELAGVRVLRRASSAARR